MAALTPFATPGEALAAQAAARGTAPALLFPASGGRIDFAGWDRAATALARALLARGLRPGDHLALLAENRLEWPVAQLAAARAGLVLVPLNTHYRRDDLAYALQQSEARALICSTAFRSNDYLATALALRAELPRLELVIALDEPAPGSLAYGALLEEGGALSLALPPVAAEDIAALLYTSGTTGFPKGALLTHHAMLANAFGTATRLGIAAGDRWTSIIPLFHCAGCIMNLLGALQTGAAYVGLPAFDPLAMLRLIEAERCTALSGVPTSYLAMLDHAERERHDLSSLRVGTCGGADVDPALLARCAAAFPMPGLCQVYGQTEAATLIACPAHDDPRRFASAGPPLPGYEVRITDPVSGDVLGPGAMGQIEARGAMIMRGYYRNPEASRETVSAEGWLKTGDLGSLDPEGRVVMAGGRLRDMIIRGGENIYPVEIETLIAGHPAVAEVAVFGIPDAYYGEIVAAALRLAEPVEAEALGRFCAGRIARFKLPAAYFLLESFPLTASGKIRKTVLREMAAAGTLARLD